MQGYNCIIVFSTDGKKLLFCKRSKAPYEGLYNLVGGKIEYGENGYEAAYRELEEETGINQSNIQLSHMMDFTYYNQDCYVEIYAGYLNSEVVLREEAHPLVWLDQNEDFFDSGKFAGEGNIGHMVEQVKCYGLGIPQNQEKQDLVNKLDIDSLCIGVDGCKGGWIAAILNHGKLFIEKYNSLNEIVSSHGDFDEFLIDMVIGLSGTNEQIRPDVYARRIISERSSTIFPAPCRQAVYAETVAKSYDENVRVLGKKFNPLTVGIMPKMREVDKFLQENTQYKNIIKESHPEVCFARLNGSTVLSKKVDINGMEERIHILSKYIKDLNLNKVIITSKSLKCKVDDIVDAICLAVTANLVIQEKYDVIPEFPMKDDTGLIMQMVIPK